MVCMGRLNFGGDCITCKGSEGIRPSTSPAQSTTLSWTLLLPRFFQG